MVPMSGVKVKLAVATELLVSPLAAAIALMVSAAVADSAIAPAYLVEDVVGVLPSLV
jgi:hypothetical protein